MDVKRLKTAACTAFLKTLMMAFNLIFFVIGFAFLISGIYGFKVFRQFFSFAPSTSIYFPIISIGLFMMFVGILSLWCTPKGTVWLLNLYSILIFLLFLCIFSVSILFTVRHDALEGTLRNGIERSMKHYPNETQSIDVLQSTIKCCGSDNYTDWFSTSWGQAKRQVPKSCCIRPESCVHENLNSQNLTDIYTQGCFNKVFKTIEDKYVIICAIGFTSSVVILGGAFLSCLLTQNLNKHRYEQME